MIKKLIFAMAVVSLAACTKAPDVDSNNTDSGVNAAMQKIVNTPEAAEAGSLIVCFNDNAIATIEAATAAARATRSVATRSGILAFDDALSTLQCSYLERVFPCNQRTEERTREAGLHKWYVIYFDSEKELSAAALSLASVPEVQHVQFSITAKQMLEETIPLSKVTHSVTRVTTNAPFNDPQLPLQWHYINDGNKQIAATNRAGADINAGEAWKITTGDPQVIVAIVDQGVKYTHPDLAANMWVNNAELHGAPGIDDDNNGYVDDIYGLNFATNGPITWAVVTSDTQKDTGHGTHVAGTVAAVNNNGIGIAGVAGGSGNGNGVRIMSCQVFSGEKKAVKSGSPETRARAIKYAADMGASIIQCSYGTKGGDVLSDNDYQNSNTVEIAAINYFISTSNCAAIDGGLAIFAAGNEHKPYSSYPAAYRRCISVAAIGPDYLPAYYTNYSSGVNISAPGGDLGLDKQPLCGVLSTLPSELYNGDDYGYQHGTSMACPHVSGVAALGLSYALAKGKHFTNNEFKYMILTSVNDLEAYMTGTKHSIRILNLEDYRLKMGTGTIDAYQLLMQIEGTPCLKAKVGKGQRFPLTQYFGGSAENLTYTDVAISDADMEKLGITDKPMISKGDLIFRCTKPGVVKITISAIAGGNSAGTGSSMGGMPISKKVAIIAREVEAGNGGWL